MSKGIIMVRYTRNVVIEKCLVNLCSSSCFSAAGIVQHLSNTQQESAVGSPNCISPASSVSFRSPIKPSLLVTTVGSPMSAHYKYPIFFPMHWYTPKETSPFASPMSLSSPMAKGSFSPMSSGLSLDTIGNNSTIGLVNFGNILYELDFTSSEKCSKPMVHSKWTIGHSKMRLLSSCHWWQILMFVQWRQTFSWNICKALCQIILMSMHNMMYPKYYRNYWWNL